MNKIGLYHSVYITDTARTSVRAKTILHHENMHKCLLQVPTVHVHKCIQSHCNYVHMYIYIFSYTRIFIYTYIQYIYIVIMYICIYVYLIYYLTRGPLVFASSKFGQVVMYEYCTPAYV
jgi:hypothetical protein